MSFSWPDALAAREYEIWCDEMEETPMPEKTTEQHLGDLTDFVKEIVRPDLLSRNMVNTLIAEMIRRCRALDKQMEMEKRDACAQKQ